jgi:hypothetical protein
MRFFAVWEFMRRSGRREHALAPPLIFLRFVGVVAGLGADGGDQDWPKANRKPERNNDETPIIYIHTCAKYKGGNRFGNTRKLPAILCVISTRKGFNLQS